MKVAIIINTSWNIFNFRKGLVKYFLDRGDQVVAIAPKDDYSAKLVDWGCEYLSLEMRGTGMNPVQDLGLMLQIRSRLKQCRPDVVLTYTIKPNLYGSLAAWSIGIPAICNVSGLGTVFLWKGALKRLAVALYSFCFRFNFWVFFQNDEDREEFMSLIPLNKNKTSLLPGSGINTREFPFSPANNEQPVFLMIGRLIVEKGVRDYAEAIRILKRAGYDVEFKLAGGLDLTHARSIEKDELDEWISEGLMTYLGQLSDVRSEVEKADVMVLPSYREGTPRTLLEGGAMGKALLASDVPGCRHVVKDGVNGFLFEVRNPTDLADKMKLYLSLSSSERAEMGRASRIFVENTFDERLVIDSYAQKIDNLLSKRR